MIRVASILYLFLSGTLFASQHVLNIQIINQACIQPYKNYHYTTCAPIRFIIEEDEFIIPAGFITDLASIPKPLWSIISPAHSSVITPSIIHDWFYRKTCIFTRKQADLIFYYSLLTQDVPKPIATLFYYGVRLFGASSFKEDYCHDTRQRVESMD